MKSGKSAGSTRELKAVGRHEWRMATAPLDKAADGSALPPPATGARASHEVYVTQWNDSSKSKDVRVASTCLFGDTYETTIGRKLKAEDAAKHPEMGRVGDRVRHPSLGTPTRLSSSHPHLTSIAFWQIQRETTRPVKDYNENYNSVDTSDMDWDKVCSHFATLTHGSHPRATS